MSNAAKKEIKARAAAELAEVPEWDANLSASENQCRFGNQGEFTAKARPRASRQKGRDR